MNDLFQQFQSEMAQLYSAVLADVLDTLGHRHSALPPRIRSLQSEWKVFGRAVTLSAVSVASEPKDPYAVELECIDSLQPGDVLIATTHGDERSALWGELLSTASRAHGALGVILNGLTRDASKILEMGFPVFATGFSPLDSKGRLDAIAFQVPIQIGDCVIHPGDLVMADMDGVVVIPQNLAEQALTAALEKVRGENRVREELAKGRSVKEVFAEYGIL